MRQKKLAPILAVTISLELIVSPLMGYAQTTQKQNNTAQNIVGAIDAAGKLWSAVMQTQMSQSPQMAYDAQKLQEQQTPIPDKYFQTGELLKIPGLSQYLAINGINPARLNCSTLPTTMHEVKSEACLIGVTTDTGMNPQIQLNEMFGLYNQYFQIEKVYKNYSATSQAAGYPQFGMSCMNGAKQILDGFFKYRLDELDKIVTNMEAIQNQFRENSRGDLDALEEAVAYLEGGDSIIANKVKSKKPELFDFAKKFDNKACTSMFDKENYNKMGREKGLNNIKNIVNDTVNDKSGGKYSGASYAQSNGTVVDDIKAMADKIAKQSELNFSSLADESGRGYGQFVNSLSRSVSSTTGVNQALTADLFSDIQTSFTEKNNKLMSQMNEVAAELAAQNVDTSRARAQMKNLNASNFETELAGIERQIQNSCLKDNTTDAVLSRIFQKSASSHANKNASNFLKDKLKAVMENPNTSLEKKLEELQNLDSAYTDYYVRSDNTREVEILDENGNIKKIKRSATVLQTPSAYFVDTIRNCQAQYKKNKLNNKMSGSDAIQQLRTLNQNYKKLASSHATDLKAEVMKKLIDCDGNADKANSSVIGSCTPSSFNTSSPGFCAKGAYSCSQNMQACNKMIEDEVAQVKQQKTLRVNNYKALLKKNKDDIVKLFDSALSQYMRDGEIMRGLYGAGFSSPAGVQREVPESSRYLAEFRDATAGSDDGSLLLEDPDKYVAMFKQNMELLKKSVKAQQEELVGNGGRGGLFAKHLEDTKRNYQAVEKEANKFSEKCLSQYQRYVQEMEQQKKQQMAEMQKKNTELGEKRAEYCNRFRMAANNNPAPACNGNTESIFAPINDLNGDMIRYCTGTQNSSDTSDSSRLTLAAKTCLSAGIDILDDSTPTTSSPESDGKPEDNSDLKKFCATLKTCYNEESIEVTNPETKKTTMTKGCSDNQLKLNTNVDRVLNTSGVQPVLSMEDAPYFCNAADNSGREIPGSMGGTGSPILDGFYRGLAR